MLERFAIGFGMGLLSFIVIDLLVGCFYIYSIQMKSLCYNAVTMQYQFRFANNNNNDNDDNHRIVGRSFAG